jgi:dethiobiotin synthetase
LRRYLVTGTDTDVGKTRVAATLALALQNAGQAPTFVKLVQTGMEPGDSGDAARVSVLAGCSWLELARFTKAADPWSAALADGSPVVRAEDLARALNAVEGALVAEGAGGLAVPLNRLENFASVAKLAQLPIVLAIGLRLGCMNHALLTISLCEQLDLKLAGAVLVDRWEASEPSYVADVRRALQGKVEILGILPFERDETASVQNGTQLFATLV